MSLAALQTRGVVAQQETQRLPKPSAPVCLAMMPLRIDADVILHVVWPHRLDSRKNPSEYQVWVGKNKMRPINLTEVDCRYDPTRQTIRVSRSGGNVIYKPAFRQNLTD